MFCWWLYVSSMVTLFYPERCILFTELPLILYSAHQSVSYFRFRILSDLSCTSFYLFLRLCFDPQNLCLMFVFFIVISTVFISSMILTHLIHQKPYIAKQRQKYRHGQKDNCPVNRDLCLSFYDSSLLNKKILFL